MHLTRGRTCPLQQRVGGGERGFACLPRDQSDDQTGASTVRMQRSKAYRQLLARGRRREQAGVMLVRQPYSLRRCAADIELGRAALRTAERRIEYCPLDTEMPPRICDGAVRSPQRAADLDEFITAG